MDSSTGKAQSTGRPTLGSSVSVSHLQRNSKTSKSSTFKLMSSTKDKDREMDKLRVCYSPSPFSGLEIETIPSYRRVGTPSHY